VTHDEARAEDGFTLIELVMALTVLAIAILGVTNVFAASIRTGAADVHRTNAVALATQWREQMAAVPYADLGSSDSPACRGNPFVAGNGQPSAPAPQTIAGSTYTVNLCVTAPVSPTPDDAYKLTTVEVTWTDDTGSHAVWQDSAVHPAYSTPFDPTATPTTQVVATDCRLSGVSVWNNNGLGDGPAIARPGDGQLPPGSVGIQGTAHGSGCENLNVTYQPTAGTSAGPISVGAVADGDSFSLLLPPASAETWDLGLHAISVNNFNASIAQAAVCIVSASSSVLTC